MTAQEIFDKVCNHLITQNRQSADSAGRCKYRYNTLKCAVGCLIPDEVYVPEMEGALSRLTSSSWGLGWMEEHILLLSELQRVHDLNDPENWKRRLRMVSVTYNLDQPECIRK